MASLMHIVRAVVKRPFEYPERIFRIDGKTLNAKLANIVFDRDGEVRIDIETEDRDLFALLMRGRHDLGAFESSKCVRIDGCDHPCCQRDGRSCQHRSFDDIVDYYKADPFNPHAFLPDPDEMLRRYVDVRAKANGDWLGGPPESKRWEETFMFDGGIVALMFSGTEEAAQKVGAAFAEMALRLEAGGLKRWEAILEMDGVEFLLSVDAANATIPTEKIQRAAARVRELLAGNGGNLR